MNKEDIFRRAQEAFDVQTDSRGRTTFSGDSYAIERFAALVASAEREACAEVGKHALPNHSDLGLVVEAAIRARGQV